MAKKRKKEKEKNGAICPHCTESHPFGTQFCPNTGIQLSQELLENEKLKTENKELEKKRWFHLKLNIFFSAFSILLIIPVLVIILGFAKDNIPGKGKERPIEPVPGIFRSGKKVTLKYQAVPKYPQLVPDMVEAYLEQFNASGIERIRKNKEEITVKGIIPDKDKQVNAEIRLKGPAILLDPTELKQNGDQGKIKAQLIQEKTRREEIELQLSKEKGKREDVEEKLKAEKIEKEVIQNQLTQEEKKRIDTAAKLDAVTKEKETVQSQ